ncbi:MAG: glycoside hydrolase family 88 protein [Bacteroidota bacterium]
MKKALGLMVVLFGFGCEQAKKTNNIDQPISTLNDSTDRIIAFEKKSTELLSLALQENKIPRTEENGEMVWATKYNDSGEPVFDWTIGFFPGTCWYLYETTGDEKWKEAAMQFQQGIQPFKNNTRSHDLGFVFYCSFGNALRLTGDDDYKEVLINAGNSLLQRFNPKVGCIQSWDVDKGWQSTRDWKFPVIIDNMMNLELLFELTELTGDPKYRETAISHADVTLQHHFREDNSSYHVIDYDPDNGEVRKRNTAQGYDHESAWARGQAWGLYGYTVCYRYTKDQKYLDQARKIADFIITNPNLPEDGIPYWDYNAPKIPDEPRDVSAAAITASALIELNRYTEDQYKDFANKLVDNLSSDRYLVPMESETKFVLKHSVGSIPHGAEIDEPLIYADYYYLEALVRSSAERDPDLLAVNPNRSTQN